MWGNGRLRKLLAASGLLLVLAPALPAQAPGRIATTPQALLDSPMFFHGKRVAVYGQVVEAGEQSRLQIAVEEAAFGKRTIPLVFVFWKEQPSRPEGEIRGEFWDLGRINADDGRFSAYDFKRMLETATNGRWPGPDELFVLLGADMIDAPLPATPSLRAIVMAPDRYADREIAVVGRFRGRNLYGDLPGPLNKSRWDFVLQSADAAVWTSGLQPRGDGFNLDPGARVDTGKWLRVNGTVRTERKAVWIEAKSIELSTAPEETTVDVELPPVPKAPPPVVVFSAPIPDEAGVERTTDVRIQFSWDMVGRSFGDRVRVRYVGAALETVPEPPQFKATYNEGNRALAIKFTKPLEPFHTVRVELLEGITATDGQPLQPWSLTFTTGS